MSRNNKPKTSLSKKIYTFGKRIQDVFLSLIALIILAIPMLFVALVVYLDDPFGSPFFIQLRVGKDGRSFKLIKFRSMFVDAEERLGDLLADNERDGPAFKIENDPRTTRFGKVIRSSNIDELPQLINVLKGDMSIVGPRPPLPREVVQYTPYQMQRLSVTPGLTCYWQISPRRHKIKFEDWVELDLKYIRERSFLVDWKIIFNTFRTVFGRNGE